MHEIYTWLAYQTHHVYCNKLDLHERIFPSAFSVLFISGRLWLCFWHFANPGKQIIYICPFYARIASYHGSEYVGTTAHTYQLACLAKRNEKWQTPFSSAYHQQSGIVTDAIFSHRQFVLTLRMEYECLLRLYVKNGLKICCTKSLPWSFGNYWTTFVQMEHVQPKLSVKESLAIPEQQQYLNKYILMLGVTMIKQNHCFS